jgi:short-subunit dehydrogenase
VFRSRRQLSNCRVIVTGASSGIGRALAVQLAQRGARLILTARRKQRLADLVAEIGSNSDQISFVAGDICDLDHQRAIIDATQRRLGGLDVLVNNAGVGGIGSFASATPHRLRHIMNVNFFAAADLIRLALPMLRASPDAAVVNMCSVLGHVAVPHKSEYCASKFALHGFSDALRAEFSKDAIEVLLVSPSTTASEFFVQAMRSEGNSAANRRPMTAEKVAARTIRAIERRQREVILPTSGILLVWADRLLPGLTARCLRRFAQR